ncbi:hypothetical protein AB0K52_18600 [Glycomyces sp. NPDC049804]
MSETATEESAEPTAPERDRGGAPRAVRAVAALLMRRKRSET